MIRRAAAAACLAVVCAMPARAQQPDQPVAVPAPEKPAFMSRADFQLSASALTDSDVRYSWDTHWGGSLDVLDYVRGRLGVYADYEALLGDEFRLFDPNQGNYTLETFATGRINNTTEGMVMFHHVSRHLADRPKRFAIAWNELGARLLKHYDVKTTVVDLDIEAGRVLQHSFVDYLWIAEFHGQARHPINQVVAVFGRGMVQWFGVHDQVPERGRQAGGFIEGGLRLKGTAAVLELFAGYERRVDADPVARVPEKWGMAGFRLLSR